MQWTDFQYLKYLSNTLKAYDAKAITFAQNTFSFQATETKNKLGPVQFSLIFDFQLQRL